MPPNILDELQANVALPLPLFLARGVTLLPVSSIQRLGCTALASRDKSAITCPNLVVTATSSAALTLHQRQIREPLALQASTADPNLRRPPDVCEHTREDKRC